LKGVEDLGNGLSANFVYEAGVAVNNGGASAESSGQAFGRQTTLGIVSKSWGGVDLGMRTAPSTAALSGIDPFAAGFNTASMTSTFGQNFVRYSNMLMYSSPSFSGFTGYLGYSFDTSAKETAYIPNPANPTSAAPVTYTTPTYGTTNKTRAVSLGLRYANGPILVAGTYDQVMAGTSTTGQVQPTSSLKTWALAGTYDFKIAKIHASYGQNIDGLFNYGSTFSNAALTGGATNSSGGFLFAPGARTNQWMIGVSAPVGASGSVFASWQQQLPGGNLKNVTTNANMNIGSIGYTYSLSKRTNLYAFYSYVNNAAMVSGVKASTLGAGVRHLF